MIEILIEKKVDEININISIFIFFIESSGIHTSGGYLLVVIHLKRLVGCYYRNLIATDSTVRLF